MYDFILKEQIDQLIKDKLVAKKDSQKALESLQKCWDDRIAITWTIDDVIDYAKGIKKRVSKDKARQILQAMLRRHDAEYGINWQTIDANL